jgi:hypothetical protein
MNALRATACILGIAVACLPAGEALAADPAEEARIAEAENLIGVLERFAEATDKQGLAGALPRIVKSHNELKTDSVRRKLQAALGGVLGGDALGAVRMKAADALGRLNDPPGAWKHLRRHLPSVREKACGPFPLRVIQAVGALAPDAAITSLERLMEDAKDANVSRYAIQALGKYGWSKKRVRVLEDVARYLQKLRPGGGGGGRTGRGASSRQRYDFLRATITAALNELTGQELVSADAWIELYEANKKTPKKLFKVQR